MGSGFGKSNSTPQGDQSFSPHQERVYGEMFRAIEQLGRKLEKSEGERERLARRLSLIESAATVDEKTGRLYLPAITASAQQPSLSPAAPRWAVGLSLGSAFIALFALGFTFFQLSEPALSPQQMAALDAMVNARVAALDETGWQEVQKTEALAEVDNAYRMPDTDASGTPDSADLMAAAEIFSQIEPATGSAEITAAENRMPDTLASDGMDLIESVGDIPEKTESAELPAEDVTPTLQAEAEAEKTPRARESAEAVKTAQQRKVAAKAPTKSLIEADASLPEDIKPLERRAFEGLAEAQHDLATIYASGKMMARDYKRAVYWFSRAADGGVANAHYNLGVMFQQGLGVQKDIRKAVGWYQSAANLGHPEAMYNLGIAYVEGVGVARNIERGASYFRRAANGGVAQAAYNLGVLYETNFLGAVDFGKAEEWYRVAANEGHQDAKAAIQRVQKQRAVAEAEGKKLSDTIAPAAGGNN